MMRLAALVCTLALGLATTLAAALQVHAQDPCGTADGIACDLAVLADPSAATLAAAAKAHEDAGEIEAAQDLYARAAAMGDAGAAAGLDRLGRSAGDPVAALLASSGGDPVAIATALSAAGIVLPTGAALRDPLSVLALGRGSEPELARALAAVLRTAHPQATVSFGHCTLSAPQALALADRIAAQRQQASPSMSAALAELRDGTRLGASGLVILEEITAAWTAALADGRAEVAALVEDLSEAALGLAPLGPEALAARLAAQPFATVEFALGADALVLDPVSGMAFDTAACASYQAGLAEPPAATPTLRVTLTALAGPPGTPPAERVLLETEVPFDRGMAIASAERWGFDAPPVNAPGLMVYTPMLVAGPEVRLGTPLALPPAADDFGFVRDGLDGFLDGDGTTGEADLPADDLVRLVLTAGLSGAGAPDEVQRLVLYDRDAAGAGDPHAALLQAVTITPLDGGADTLPRPAGPPPEDTGAAAGLLRLRLLAGAMSGFDGLRRLVFAELSGEQPPLPLGVGMLLSQWRLTDAADGGGVPVLSVRQQMLRPFEPALADDDAPRRAAEWAVASVLAERLSLTMPDLAVQGLPTDAVAAFGQLRLRGLWAEPTAAADLAALPAEARTSLGARDAAGWRLLAAREAVAAGDPEDALVFWQVWPDGATIEDVFASGGRQAGPEHAALTETVACRQVAVASRFSRKLHVVLVAAGIAIMAHAGAVPGADRALAEAVAEMIEARTKAEEVTEAAEAVAMGSCGGGGVSPP